MLFICQLSEPFKAFDNGTGKESVCFVCYYGLEKPMRVCVCVDIPSTLTLSRQYSQSLLTLPIYTLTLIHYCENDCESLCSVSKKKSLGLHFESSCVYYYDKSRKTFSEHVYIKEGVITAIIALLKSML